MIPPFNPPYLCSTSNTCEMSHFIKKFKLALKPGTNYMVKEKLGKLVTNNTNCVNDSIALILTDIPCSQYSKYPDLKQLFGDKNLNRTIKWLTELRLLTVVFYLSICLSDQELNHVLSVTTTSSTTKLTTCGYIDRHIWRHRLWFAEQHTLNARRLLFGRTRNLDEWEVTPLNLRIETDHIIGSGVSAAVYKGYLKRDKEPERIIVAAKFAHTYSSRISKKAMMKEIELMKTLEPHPNIVKFYGCVSKIEQPTIATEFCSRDDLLKHLQTQKLLVRDLHRIASEVCSAMIHLSSLGLVHRDLAARNVLLTDDLTAKVGDLGLCCRRDQMLSGEKLPVTHMPSETLKFGHFSKKSDVWSFGCLLFEMFSEGRRSFSDV
ncbi:Protein kinase domain-containing protein [Aphelenchoides besseyi]|nr:Protein kinase domain-containing protein [Aphelenchoides besseyi]